MTAELVRAAAKHVAALGERMSAASIARTAGVSAHTVQRVLAAPGASQMRETTARKLLAVPIPDITPASTMLVSTGRTRRHIHTLMDHGHTQAVICKAAGVSESTVRTITNGTRTSVELGTEARILAITPGSLPTRPERVDAGPVREHLAELMAAGGSMPAVADLCGVSRTFVYRLIRGGRSTLLEDAAERLLAVRMDDLPAPVKRAPRKPAQPAPREPRLHERPWGEVRRTVALLAQDGTPVAQIAASTGLPESRVRDALAGVSGARGLARSWPPAAAAQTRTTTRGRAA